MTDPEHRPKLSGTRVVEAVVIAIVTAVIVSLGSSYVTVSALRVEIDGIKTSVSDLKTETKADLRDLRSVIYRPSWERDREATLRAGPDGVSTGTRPRNPNE